MSRDYLKDYNKQDADEEELDEVDKAWKETETPEVEDALKKHPAMKWFLIIAGGALAVFCVGCIIVRAVTGEFSHSEESSSRMVEKKKHDNGLKSNSSNNSDNVDFTEDNATPETSEGNSSYQDVQPTYHNAPEMANEKYNAPVDSSYNTVYEEKSDKAKTCVYRNLYGEKTPTDLADESYMVKYYYNQYLEADQEYQTATKMYANSTSDSYRQKITQAEFAKSKAYTLYEREFNETKSRYEDMLNECQ